MSSSPKFFEILAEVVKNRAEPLGYLAKHLGLKLDRSARSNQYFDVYESGASSRYEHVKAAEVRLPVDRSPGKGGFISLSIDPGIECISVDQIFSRFGDKPELGVPTPRQPATAPLYYLYRYPWGELRLGVSRGAPECLETAVVDYKN